MSSSFIEEAEKTLIDLTIPSYFSSHSSQVFTLLTQGEKLFSHPIFLNYLRRSKDFLEQGNIDRAIACLSLALGVVSD